jgi:hypothetical protein
MTDEPSPEAIVDAISQEPIVTWGDLKRIAVAYGAHVEATDEIKDDEPIKDMYYVGKFTVGRDTSNTYYDKATAIADDAGPWPNIKIEFWSNERMRSFVDEFRTRLVKKP